ncbi:unnamed protein product [Lathyrus oleraceus]
MTTSCTLLMEWILQHFPHISDWSYVDHYTEDMPSSCAFVSLRENQTIKSFRVYLDRIIHNDICFRPYNLYHQMHPWDDISFYFGWLTCGSRMMYPRFPKRVMP